MQAVLTFRNLWQQAWLAFVSGSSLLEPDRAVKSVMRERAEHIDAARRYWACPF